MGERAERTESDSFRVEDNFVSVLPVVGLVLVVLAVVAARAAMFWWARQPIGPVHTDGRVELRVAARLLEPGGRCEGDGRLVVANGRVQVTMGNSSVLARPVEEVTAAVITEPRPAVALSGAGWRRLVVVDRVRPVPVATGPIGRVRQTTTAQVVIGAIGESVREGGSAGASASGEPVRHPA